MGMYDSLICRKPLPGTPPAFIRADHEFQTKDLDCCMNTYVIAEDGRLMLSEVPVFEMVLEAIGAEKGQEPTPVDFTGTLDFYSSNCRGSSGGFMFTENGEDYESVDYAAKFLNGGLLEITETHRERKPALPVAEMTDSWPKPTDEDRARWAQREAEQLTGREMWLAWGGSENGQAVTVVADGKREWCCRDAEGDLHNINRKCRDSILFDSEADAKKHRDDRESERESKAKRWRAMLEAKAQGSAQPA